MFANCGWYIAKVVHLCILGIHHQGVYKWYIGILLGFSTIYHLFAFSKFADGLVCVLLLMPSYCFADCFIPL